jgi:hypothetical protein
MDNMFLLVSKAFRKIRKDYLLLLPYSAIYLVFSIIDNHYFAQNNTITLAFIAFSYAQSVCQSSTLLVLVSMAFSKTVKPLSEILNKGILFAAFLNIPFACLMLGYRFVSSDTAILDSHLFMLGLFMIAIVVFVAMVPFSAFSYFSLIHFSLKNQPSSIEIWPIFKRCLRYYRQCLRWFLSVFVMNSFLLFFIPLQSSSFLLADTLFSLIQGFLSTLAVLFSYYFYKEFKKLPLVNSIV